MAKKQWIDHQGRKVPSQYVPSIDKKKERLALRVAKKAQSLHDSLAKFKDELLEQADALYDEMLEDNNIKPSDRKGNYSITTFNKDIKIEVNVQEKIEFDDHINLAQAKITEFLELKMAGIDSDLTLLINDAFRTNRGRMQTNRVLGLFKLEIKHKLWEEAMTLLKKSISRTDSKRYIRIFKKGPEGDYQDITLNFSSI